jgi:DNA mismatch endonuclease (patch repair protein)
MNGIDTPMADVFTKEKRSKVMSSIRARGNKDTEIALIRLFRSGGITGWRRHMPLLGKPDFTFRKARVVVFIDGCFWHGCPQHGTRPKSNKSYWHPKLLRNQRRDRAVKRALAARGWRVLRFWEHELKQPEKLILRIADAISDVSLDLGARLKSNTPR